MKKTFKYGITNEKGIFLNSFSEHTGGSNIEPLSFNSVEEAELYAKTNGLERYVIGRIIDAE